MDEAFWANVVKRWSEASETVIKLKKELAQVHEEVSCYAGSDQVICSRSPSHQRELYRDVVQNLRKPGGMGEGSGSRLRRPLSGHTRHESGRTIVVEDENTSSLRDELKDAEAGLGRAKDEYRRLQKEVRALLPRLCVLIAHEFSPSSLKLLKGSKP